MIFWKIWKPALQRLAVEKTVCAAQMRKLQEKPYAVEKILYT